MSADFVGKTEAFVKEYMSKLNDVSHDWVHVERVRKMALYLASFEQDVDKELVELAALLHDVGDFKHTFDQSEVSNSVTAFLESIVYPKAQQVTDIVSNVSYRSELALEGAPPKISNIRELACVQDGDRLDAIGAIGVARCMAFNSGRLLPIYDSSNIPNQILTLAEYNQQTKANNGNAINHFYEKLVKLAALMKTEQGKIEAKKRHEFLVSFLRNLEHECGLPSYRI